MSDLSEDRLRQLMLACTPEHPPMPYVVYTYNSSDNRKQRLNVRYVRADSRRKAALSGLLVDRYTFGTRKAVHAEAYAEWWDIEVLKKTDTWAIWELRRGNV